MRAINTKNDDLPGDGLLLTGSEPINRPLGYLPTEDKIRIMNKAMHIFRLFDWCKIQGCQSNEMSLSLSPFSSVTSSFRPRCFSPLALGSLQDIPMYLHRYMYSPNLVHVSRESHDTAE